MTGGFTVRPMDAALAVRDTSRDDPALPSLSLAESVPLAAAVGAAAPPTQVRRPWRATLRTGFAAAVALGAMLPLLVEASGLDETAAPVGGALAIAAGVTRVMALPAVEEFLRRFVPWLAAAPSVDGAP